MQMEHFDSMPAEIGSLGEETPMRIFQVSQVSSGTVLWVGGALSEDGALDVMAREAGYRMYSELPQETVNGLVVRELFL